MKLTQWMLAGMVCALLVLAGCPSGSSTPVKQDSPEDVVETMILAASAMDTEAIGKVVHPDYSESMKTMMESLKKMTAKMKELADAAEAKYDKETAKPVREMADMFTGGKGLGGEALKDGKVDRSKIKVETSGDTATATIEGGSDKIKVVKKDGKWYAVPEQSKEEMAEQSKKMKEELDKQLPKMDELIKKVKAGEVAKDDFLAEFMKVSR